ADRKDRSTEKNDLGKRVLKIVRLAKVTVAGTGDGAVDGDGDGDYEKRLFL
ncbi:hypothetical protein Tco_1496822, partial [Tanacetum coccineum]